MKHLKQEFDKLTFKEAIVYGMAVISLFSGFILLFVALFTAPRGQIHESVLTAFSIILIFIGSLLGISMHYANELFRFKTSVSDQLAHSAGSYLATHGIPPAPTKATESDQPTDNH